MAALAPYLVVGWLAVGLVFFRRLRPALAVLAIVVLGQLFLPEVHSLPRAADTPVALNLPIVKFTKSNAISYALLLGSLVFDRRRWATAYPRWFDVPMALWCIAPLVSSVVERTGPLGGWFEGVTVALGQTLAWGVPYWFGRLYLADRDGLRALAGAIVLGGLIYVPFCLFEQTTGPHLHRYVYGFYQHDVVQAIREAGYRPMVFMEHGLAVSFWMVSAALVAFWLWREGTYRALVYHPRRRALGLGPVVLVLVATAALSQSAGAIILGIVGLIVLLISRRFRTAALLAVFLVAAPAYIAARVTNTWTGAEPVALLRPYLDAQRIGSYEFRIEQEADILARASEKPIFGWGVSGKWRIEGKRGQDVTISDSLWIITYATAGGFGLATLACAVLLPVARYLWHYPPRLWAGPADAPAAVLAVVLNLHMLDHLVNAMLNPVYMLAAGGLAGAATRLNASDP